MLLLGLIFSQQVSTIKGSVGTYTVEYIDYSKNQFGATFEVKMPLAAKIAADKYVATSMKFTNKNSKPVKMWRPFKLFIGESLWLDAREPIDNALKDDLYVVTFRFIAQNPLLVSGVQPDQLAEMLIPDKATGYLLRFLPELETSQQRAGMIENMTPQDPSTLASLPSQPVGAFLSTEGLIDILASGSGTNDNMLYIIIGGVGIGLVILIILFMCIRSRRNTTPEKSEKVYYDESKSNATPNNYMNQPKTTERPATEWSEYDHSITDVGPKSTILSDRSNTVYTDFTENDRPNTEWSELDSNIRESQFQSGELETIYEPRTRNPTETVYTDFDEDTTQHTKNETMYTDFDDNTTNNQTMYTDVDTTYSKNETMYTDFDESTTNNQTMYTDVDTTYTKNETLYSDLDNDTTYSRNETMYTDVDEGTAYGKSETMYTEETNSAYDTMYTDDSGFNTNTVYTERVDTMYSDMSSVRGSEFTSTYGTEYSDMRDSYMSEDQ